MTNNSTNLLLNQASKDRDLSKLLRIADKCISEAAAGNKTAIKIIKKSEPFILGKCQCGCGESIPIRSTGGVLQKFKQGHQSKGRVIKRAETT